MRALLPLLARLRRRLLLHRRGLAALGAGLAALVLVPLLRPSPPPTVEVWVATHDVAAGEALEADDLRTVRWPAALAPPSAVSTRSGRDRLIGRTTVMPVQRGQPVTARSVLANAALAGHPGRDAVAVRVPDPDVVDLLVPGDAIDLWVTDVHGDGGARKVVTGARVLAVPPPREGVLGSEANGRVVVLAVDRESVADVTAAVSGGFLNVVWSR